MVRINADSDVYEELLRRGAPRGAAINRGGSSPWTVDDSLIRELIGVPRWVRELHAVIDSEKRLVNYTPVEFKELKRLWEKRLGAKPGMIMGSGYWHVSDAEMRTLLGVRKYPKK